MFFFLDFLEDFLSFDLFFTLMKELDVLDSELDEYHSCFVDKEDVLDELESDDEGSEGSKGESNNFLA